MRFSKCCLIFLITVVQIQTAMAVVDVSSADLQNSAIIIMPSGEFLPELSGYSKFRLLDISAFEKGLIASYTAQSLEKPGASTDLPILYVTVQAYESQNAAREAFAWEKNSGFFKNNSISLTKSEKYALSYTSEYNDILDTFGSSFRSLNLIEVRGNLIYHSSMFNAPNLISKSELVYEIQNKALAFANSQLNALFPPAQSDVSLRQTNSSFALDSLFQIPLHGKLSFDLYVGEENLSQGTLMDSSGTDLAENGDLYLYLDGTNYAHLGIYTAKGWTRMRSVSPLRSFEWNKISINYGAHGLGFSVNEELATSASNVSITDARSSKTLYMGDYPHDELYQAAKAYFKNLTVEFSKTISGQNWDDRLKRAIYKDLPENDPDISSFEHLHYLKIMTGSNGNINPDAFLSRAEMAKIMVLLISPDYDNEQESESKTWYIDFVQKALELKLFFGREDGEFYPAEDVNQAEFFTVLARAANYENEEASAEWFANGKAYANNFEYLQSEEFEAASKISRREAAQYLTKFIDLSK